MFSIFKYFSFKGTATRSEFWKISAVNILIATALFYISISLIDYEMYEVSSLIVMVTTALSFLLTLSTVIRRCADININPWWSIVAVIPYVGFVFFIIVGIAPSHEATVT